MLRCYLNQLLLRNTSSIFHHRSSQKNLDRLRLFSNGRPTLNTTQLTHVTEEDGRVKMVDVSGKVATKRVAFASCCVLLSKPVFEAVKSNTMKKGDVLTVAKLAGIMGAKNTPLLIPLCHSISLSSVDVNLTLKEEDFSVYISAEASCWGQTGVEMEALTAVSVAGLTVYDMCKSMSHNIVITDIQLQMKYGGKEDFVRS